MAEYGLLAGRIAAVAAAALALGGPSHHPVNVRQF